MAYEEATPDEIVIIDEGFEIGTTGKEEGPVRNASLFVVEIVKSCVVSGHAGHG